MGTQIKAKYDGMCKLCGEEWSVGESIFYQKEPKAICRAKDCFEGQGGEFTPFKAGQKTLTGG